MKIEPRDLQYFAVVAHLGNVGRAAEELGLSQPALSKSLRRLEQAVGAKLVRRTPKGVDLTAIGSALASRARGLRLSLDDIAREAADLSQGRAGQLRIGAGPGISVRLLPATCAAILKEVPGADLRITIGAGDVVVPAVSAGELDLGILPSRPTGYDDLVQERLFDEVFVVLASARHRLARKKQVTLEDLARERWTLGGRGAGYERLRHVFAQSGLPPPTVVVTAPYVQIRLQLLRWTDLLGIGPRRFLRDRTLGPGLVELPVEALSGRRRFDAYYRKDAYLSPVALRFIEILKSVAREIAREP